MSMGFKGYQMRAVVRGSLRVPLTQKQYDSDDDGVSSRK